MSQSGIPSILSIGNNALRRTFKSRREDGVLLAPSAPLASRLVEEMRDYISTLGGALVADEAPDRAEHTSFVAALRVAVESLTAGRWVVGSGDARHIRWFLDDAAIDMPEARDEIAGMLRQLGQEKIGDAF